MGWDSGYTTCRMNTEWLNINRLSIPKKIGLVLLVQLVFAYALIATLDADMFHRCMDGEYTTPWYDDNWLGSPYTHWMLRGHRTRTFWTHNYIKTEAWLVKEVYMGPHKTFWTCLERIPIDQIDDPKKILPYPPQW